MVERAKRGHVSGVRLHFLDEYEDVNDNINYHEFVMNGRRKRGRQREHELS